MANGSSDAEGITSFPIRAGPKAGESNVVLRSPQTYGKREGTRGRFGRGIELARCPSGWIGFRPCTLVPRRAAQEYLAFVFGCGTSSDYLPFAKSPGHTPSRWTPACPRHSPVVLDGSREPVNHLENLGNSCRPPVWPFRSCFVWADKSWPKTEFSGSIAKRPGTRARRPLRACWGQRAGRLRWSGFAGNRLRKPWKLARSRSGLGASLPGQLRGAVPAPRTARRRPTARAPSPICNSGFPSKIASEPMGVGALQSKHRFRLRSGRNQKRFFWRILTFLTFFGRPTLLSARWRAWRLRSTGASTTTALRAVRGLSEPSKQSKAADGGSLDGNQSHRAEPMHRALADALHPAASLAAARCTHAAPCSRGAAANPPPRGARA